MIGRFKLQQSDGKHCYQVLVYNLDDLKYWQNEAKSTGHEILFDYHVEENAMAYPDPAHDIYQIFPPELRRNILIRAHWHDINSCCEREIEDGEKN